MHNAKAFSPIFSIPGEKLTSISLIQPSKASSPISLSPVENVNRSQLCAALKGLFAN